MKIIPNIRLPKIGDILYIDTLGKPKITEDWYKIRGIYKVVDEDWHDYQLKVISGIAPDYEDLEQFYWYKEEFKNMKKLGYIKYKYNNEKHTF